VHTQEKGYIFAGDRAVANIKRVLQLPDNRYSTPFCDTELANFSSLGGEKKLIL
jgi:hypothetical protein